jgi:hypothetical protein
MYKQIFSLFLRERFWAWILVSRILITVSSIILIAGLLSVPIEYISNHITFMLLGIRLFYYGVMWAQIPGYTGYMPHRVLSLSVLVVELTGILFTVAKIDLWPYFLAASSFMHGIIYIIKGLGTTLQKMPNMLAILGMFHTAIAFLMDMGIKYSVSFPLLSAISIMVRVEPSMLRYSIRRTSLLTYILISVFLLMLSFRSFTVLLLIPGAIILVLNRVSLRGLYGVGSTTAKTLGLAGALSVFLGMGLDIVHMTLIGFLGVIMGSLCAPLIVPGIMGRSYRGFSPGYAVAITLIAVLRALYIKIYLEFYVEALSLLMVLIIIIYMYRILVSEKAL